ncbi:MAG: hypothetical protein ABSF59_21940 [Candidatus Sulfotelmatobacter sp.]|jgi:hypothetical protein
MRLGETIATYDVGLALRGKSGRFEVTSRAGDIYDVTCKPSHHVSNLEWSGVESSGDGADAPFLIRKMAEGASPVETKTTPAEAPDQHSHAPSSPLPFVLEQTATDAPSSSAGNIELMYLEDDPRTGQPSACICLKSEPRDHCREAATLLTSRCATLNELDSEIRRLEAQLDEIRSRAKKMFYKSQAIAASA